MLAAVAGSGGAGAALDLRTRRLPNWLTLTITGVTANNKVYDATTAATLNTGSAVLSGVISGDTVTLGAGSGVGAFASASVGTGNEPWNVREFHVRHPDGHVFRISRSTV